MPDDTRFATDLYQGAAPNYDRYRLPYPVQMLAGLAAHVHGQTGGGARLLDLACGTGQLAVPLRPYFAEVWAVDQEPDMVKAVRRRARPSCARSYQAPRISRRRRSTST